MPPPLGAYISYSKLCQNAPKDFILATQKWKNLLLMGNRPFFVGGGRTPPFKCPFSSPLHRDPGYATDTQPATVHSLQIKHRPTRDKPHARTHARTERMPVVHGPEWQRPTTCPAARLLGRRRYLCSSNIKTPGTTDGRPLVERRAVLAVAHDDDDDDEHSSSISSSSNAV